MMPLFIYILKVMLVSGILLGYYWIGLRNTRFHYYNRFYLVATVFFSLILPLLNLQWFTISSSSAKPVEQLVQYIYSPQALTQDQSVIGWDKLLSLTLFSVSLLLVCLFLYGIHKVYLIKRKGKITTMKRFDFIETDLDEAPFSFFRNLFWRQGIPVHDQTGQRMLKHELTHIEQYHSYDKLFIKLTTYLLWMNPFFWLIQNELEVVHEFIADKEAIEDQDAGILAEMLLKAHYHSNIMSVGQSFFYSSIKRRIIMLTSSQKVSYSYARRLLILPVSIGLLVLLSFSIKDSLANHPEKPFDKTSIPFNQLDTVPSKYRDTKTGKVKGSFQIDIDGDIASFKDIKTKKELFKVPLSELSNPLNKVITVQGFPLDTEKKVIFISADSMSTGSPLNDIEQILSIPPNPPKPGTPPFPTKIIINGKEISSEDLDKIDPSSIKSINIRSNEKGVAIAGKNMNGMTWTESTSADGKRMVTVKVDTVFFNDEAMKHQEKALAYEKEAKANQIKADANAAEASRFQKDAEAAMKLADANAKEADGNLKKSYIFIQKQTENTELPKNLLYVIDGKEIKSESMKEIDPTTIKMVNVIKGEAAVKKYGAGAKDGVVEITTKK